MAIAFSAVGRKQQGASAPASPITVGVTVNANDTGVAVVSFAGTTPGAATSISSGGQWSLKTAITSTNARTEIWTTPAGAASAATVIGIAFSGTNDAVEAIVGTYTGVLAIGPSKTASGTAANPSIAYSTVDANNFVVAGFGMADSLTATPLPTAGTGSLRTADNISAAGTNDLSAAFADNTSATPGTVTNSITYPNTDGHWAAASVELRSVNNGSLLTFFCNNPVQGGSSAGLLDVTAPTASTSTTGWTVGTTVAARQSRQTYNSKVAATGFTATAQPSGAPTGSAQDSWRISGVTTGIFSGGTWYSSLSVIAVTSASSTGAAIFRLWASANADGTSAREITRSRLTGGTLASTPLSTTVAQSSSASTQIPGFTLSNEFLFMEVGWATVTASVNAGSDVLVRMGPGMANTSGSGLITSLFSATGGAAGTPSAGYYYSLMADWFNR